MRHVLFLLGVVLFVTGSSSAQMSSTNPLLLAAPFSMTTSGAVSAASASTSSSATAFSLSAAPAAPVAASSATLAPNPFSAESAAAPAPAPDPQYVQGVFVNYSWQAYFGYAYFHFNGPHGISRNMNGFNYGIAYYFNNWFGIEGEMMANHDSPNNQSSWFLFGGGGPRFRWLAPKGIEVFAHALVGYSHLTPQTPYGKQEAFAYVLGGGADFNTPFRRLALRVGADMVGTRYFNGDQYNPRAYGGIVFKF